MKVTGPLFKWFGSKWMSSRHYPAPVMDRIIEPFAGSAGYSLRHAGKTCYIYDTDPHLMQLWPWLINEATERLVREIPLNVPEGTDIRTLGLSNGQALLLKTWQRTNNVGDCWTISPWGNKPGQWTANTRARVAEEVYAIKHWTFGPIDWTMPGTWFIDPPYQHNYGYRGVKPDYNAIRAKITKLEGSQFIVCEAACSKTGKLPDWLPFRESHRQVTSRRKASQSHHSKELIWTNDFGLTKDVALGKLVS